MIAVAAVCDRRSTLIERRYSYGPPGVAVLFVDGGALVTDPGPVSLVEAGVAGLCGGGGGVGVGGEAGGGGETMLPGAPPPEVPGAVEGGGAACGGVVDPGGGETTVPGWPALGGGVGDEAGG